MLSLYHDDHLEYTKGILSLKMQENTGPKTEKTNAAKLKKSLKHDFSFTNWGEATERWLKGVRKQYTTLFLEVSKQARILAGVKVKPTDSSTESLGSVSSDVHGPARPQSPGLGSA